MARRGSRRRRIAPRGTRRTNPTRRNEVPPGSRRCAPGQPRATPPTKRRCASTSSRGGCSMTASRCRGTSFADLDLRRLLNYFRDLRQQDHPAVEDASSWTRLLVNTELMIESRGRALASAAGLLLFGAHPNRYLPHAGVSAGAYAGTEKDYHAKERATVRGPVVSLGFPAHAGGRDALSQAAAQLLRQHRVQRGGRHRANARLRAPQHRLGSMDRPRRAPAGTLGVSAGSGTRGSSERRRPSRLHDNGKRRRAFDLRRPHGDHLPPAGCPTRSRSRRCAPATAPRVTNW